MASTALVLHSIGFAAPISLPLHLDFDLEDHDRLLHPSPSFNGLKAPWRNPREQSGSEQVRHTLLNSRKSSTRATYVHNGGIFPFALVKAVLYPAGPGLSIAPKTEGVGDFLLSKFSWQQYQFSIFMWITILDFLVI